MNTIKTTSLLSIAALVLAGCATEPVAEIAPVDDAPPVSSNSGDGYDDGVGLGESLMDDSSSLGDSIIYFSYDQSDIPAQYSDELARHASQLAEKPGLRVRLEGHADERGSREYNIALGERRAQAVRRVLLIQGASAGQISTVSFGEERPAALGSSESAYEQNRRVALVYQN